MRIINTSCILLLLLLSIAGAGTTDNLEFSGSITDSAVIEFFDSGEAIEGNGFLLEAGSVHPLNFLMEQSLIKYIKNSEGRVFLKINKGEVDSACVDYICKYRIVSYDLSYQKAREPHPRNKKVWRKGSLVVIFRLLSIVNGEVIRTDETIIESDDFISSTDARTFSRSGDLYIKPEVPDGGFKRFFEPVLVGGTAAVLIFLFFSNR